MFVRPSSLFWITYVYHSLMKYAHVVSVPLTSLIGFYFFNRVANEKHKQEKTEPNKRGHVSEKNNIKISNVILVLIYTFCLSLSMSTNSDKKNIKLKSLVNVSIIT